MFKLFNKKNQNTEEFVIAFCDNKDIDTKFGEYYETFKTYEDAKHRIFSKVNGWGYAIKTVENDMVEIEDAWLIIEKRG